jgi:hypothetical protein
VVEFLIKNGANEKALKIDYDSSTENLALKKPNSKCKKIGGNNNTKCKLS